MSTALLVVFFVSLMVLFAVRMGVGIFYEMRSVGDCLHNVFGGHFLYFD